MTKVIKTFKGEKVIVQSIIVDCDFCNGSGKFKVEWCEENKEPIELRDKIECPKCKGTGKVRQLFNPEKNRKINKTLL
jgi:DnaJ-class molecular chaperone